MEVQRFLFQGTTPSAMTGVTTLTITINDVNDNYPVCTRSLYQVLGWDENQATGNFMHSAK